MAQRKHQRVRFGEKTIEMQTVIIRGVECIRLQDVQLRFSSVATLCMNDVQLAFITDEDGKNLEPLHVQANTDEVIEAIAPSTTSNTNSTDQFSAIERKIDRIQVTTDRIDANTQEILNQMRSIMTVMHELEEYTTPRYFFIIPSKHQDSAVVRTTKQLFQLHYRLYFLCECSDDPEKLHIAPHQGYSIKKPRDFIARYGSYVRTALNVVQCLLTISGFVFPALGTVSTAVADIAPSYLQSSTYFDSMKEKISFAENLLDQTDTKPIYQATSDSKETPLQGADLRELASYLQIVDSNNSLGNLYRIVTPKGHVRWVCLQHYDKISYNNKMIEYIKQWETIGGRFDQEKHVATIKQVNLNEKNIQRFCQSLENGFNISKLIFEKCSMCESCLETLLEVIIRRSSIHHLELIALDVENFIGMTKYICDHVSIHLNQQSIKVRFHDKYQSGNAELLIRLLQQNKTHRTLDLSACDFFKQEQELSRCLDGNKMLTTLILNYCNNIDILNAISNSKMNTLHHIKFNHSLIVPSILSRFCEMLKKNRTLVEVDLMDANEFTDETFITNLLGTLSNHPSIKHLSIHVCNVNSSNRKESSLMYSLLNDKFMSRLCLSKSVISRQFTQALVHASQVHRSLTHLELYQNQIHADDVSQLKALHENDTLLHLIISDKPRGHSVQNEVKDGLKSKQLVIPNIDTKQRWKPYGTTVAGGNGSGDQLNQLNHPRGMFLDDDQTIYVTDYENHRIMEWKKNATEGEIVTCEIGQGNENDQLNYPRKVIVDKENDSFIICDRGNQRIVRWPRRYGQKGEVLISNVFCWDSMMDNDGYLYICDAVKHEVRRWKTGETNETIVAGGNGSGDRLDQLSAQFNIFIDDHSVYVSDSWNNRVMKWMKGAKEGIVVAGGQGEGNGLKQLSYPQGIIVDRLGSIYIADQGNHRIMRWLKGATEGSIVVGRHGNGAEPNQFSFPSDLSFDRDNNLYVLDSSNCRVQKFTVS